jgi:hypothetical protein
MRKNAHSTDNIDARTAVAVTVMGVAFPVAVPLFSSFSRS